MRNPQSRPFVLALDIGGTQTRLAAFPHPTSVDYRPLAQFPTQMDYADQLDRVVAAWDGPGLPRAVGVSIGAQVARDGRTVLTAPNLREYIGRPLTHDLAARLGCPVYLAHDGVCGVLAEHQRGALVGRDRCGYITVSTGTGAAVHLATTTSTLTISVQIGHQILDGNPLLCLCGQSGCLETITGGRQIALRTGHAPQEIGDPAFWDGVCEKLAIGLINLAQLTRVDVVALGGSIALRRRGLVPRVRELVAQRLRDATLEVRTAALGDDAPLAGAALLTELPEGAIVH